MNSNHLNKETIQGLKKIVEELKTEFKDYPKGLCEMASNKVQQKYGFEKTSGLFIFEKDGSKMGDNHAWNLTPDGHIVDLTAMQYNKNLPEIYIIKANSDIAKERYEEGACYQL